MMLDEPALRRHLADPALLGGNAFAVFTAMTGLANDVRTSVLARELVIRALALGDAVPEGYRDLLDSLVRQLGLFPYADPTLTTTLEDQMLIEAHRVRGIGEDRVFHELQLSVFRDLMNGRNVVLSAPTSVGKSLVIDAVLASGRHRISVIVVPTIALIDETRRRLVRSLSGTHDVVTHADQKRLEGRPTIYVLTQERALARDDLDDVEFFVVDEFYKLDLRRDDDRRAVDLNLCFHRLARTGAQFYLIGPHIPAVDGLDRSYSHVFLQSHFATTALDVEFFGLRSRGDERGAKLVELCRTLESPTLVYCQSPASARRAARLIFEGVDLPRSGAVRDAVAWLERRYPAEWEVVEALRHGVGIHHGNVPRPLQQFMIRAFENGDLRLLVCTSTIIEGVNTAAENVIVYDRRRHLSTVDDFTFRNIAGRAGRMSRYYVGRVFVLEEPVDEGLEPVTIPVGAQDAGTPLSLLLDLPPADLAPVSAARVAEALAASPLSEEAVRANRWLPLDAQERLHAAVSRLAAEDADSLRWSGVPRSRQLRSVCALIHDELDAAAQLRRYGVLSGDQLNAMLTSLIHADGPAAFVARRTAERPEQQSVSDAVENALGFLRNYVGYAFGRQLMAVDAVQREVFARRGERSGDYSLLAAQADSLFLPAGIFALEEYGVPPDLALRLAAGRGEIEDVDAALRMLARSDPEREDLEPFERDLLREAVHWLPPRAFADPPPG